MTVEIIDTSLAFTPIGRLVVAVETDRVAGLHDSAGAECSSDLARVLGQPPPADPPIRWLELSHPEGPLLLALHGPIHIERGDRALRCYRPALVAGYLRRACLKGVLRHRRGMAYLLDVDLLASRRSREVLACESE